MGRNSLAEVARQAGVSPSTASRVLNNKNTRIKVSEDTRKRILSIAEELDYSPNLLARRLWTSRSNIIGLVMPGRDKTHRESMFIDRPFAETLAGIESVIESTDYKLMLIFRNDKFVENKEYLTLLKSKIVDGLLIWGAVRSDDYIAEISNAPVVLLSSRPDVEVPFNYIGYDNRNGSFALAEYFIKSGFHSFAYMGNAGATNSIDAERFQGFSDAMSQYHLSYFMHRSRQDQESGFNAMRKVLLESEKKIHFDVLCCASDSLAFGAIMAAESLAMKIPDDFQISGADGVDNLLMQRYKFPTYKVPCYNVGVRGAQRILELMENPEQKPIIDIHPVELQVGDTVLRHRSRFPEKESCKLPG